MSVPSPQKYCIFSSQPVTVVCISKIGIILFRTLFPLRHFDIFYILDMLNRTCQPYDGNYFFHSFDLVLILIYSIPLVIMVILGMIACVFNFATKLLSVCKKWPGLPSTSIRNFNAIQQNCLNRTLPLHHTVSVKRSQRYPGSSLLNLLTYWTSGHGMTI